MSYFIKLILENIILSTILNHGNLYDISKKPEKDAIVYSDTAIRFENFELNKDFTFEDVMIVDMEDQIYFSFVIDTDFNKSEFDNLFDSENNKVSTLSNNPNSKIRYQDKIEGYKIYISVTPWNSMVSFKIRFIKK